MAFNAVDEHQLLVCGLKECVALTLGPRGEVVSRVGVDLMLDALGMAVPCHIVKACWLPGSASACVIVTPSFIKVYDLARDKISPTHYFQTLDDAIKDVAFVPTEGGGANASGASGASSASGAAASARKWAPVAPARQRAPKAPSGAGATQQLVSSFGPMGPWLLDLWSSLGGPGRWANDFA